MSTGNWARHRQIWLACAIGLLCCLIYLPACAEDGEADYSDFLDAPAHTEGAAKAHTWSATPSGDGEIASTDKTDENELLSAHPLDAPDTSVSELASEVLRKEKPDSTDMLANLLSDGGNQGSLGAPMPSGKLKKLMAGAVVALFGAAIGIGVTLVRRRLGKGPDPLRNVKVVRGQSPTAPRSGGKRML